MFKKCELLQIMLSSFFLQSRNSLFGLYRYHVSFLIRLFFIKGPGSYYFFLFGFWDLNLELSFLLGNHAGRYGYSWGVVWFLRSRKPDSISGTGPLLWSTVDLINFVNLCVSAICQAPCWPHILTAIFRWCSQAIHPTPCCLSKAPETPGRVSSAFQELWETFCSTIKSLLANYLRNCHLKGTGLGAGNRKQDEVGLQPSKSIQEKW